jgi:ankyrin repeat protein
MKKMMYASVVCGFLLFTKMSFAADVTEQSLDINKRLFLALDQGDMRTVRNILAANGNTDAISFFLLLAEHSFAEDSNTDRFLLWAIEQGDMRAVQDALVANADVNAQNIKGFTALMTAAATDRTDIVALLLSKKADVNAQHICGLTALMIAAANDHAPIVHLLLEAGADVNAQDNGGNTALDLAKNEQVKKVLRDFIDQLNGQKAQ